METIKAPQETAQQTLFAAAEFLKKKHSSTDELIKAIQSFIFKRSHKVEKAYEPRDIVESRFMPADEAFEKGVVTCGSLTNISSTMLRHVGYQVKLVHGECEQGVDHAWISVFVPEKNEWVEYDLATQDTKTAPGHVQKAVVNSWEEIRSQIENDRDTVQAREKELKKGVSGK